MSQPNPSDVHAPYVRELVDAGDWAGLVRYWMAHQQHQPALDQAIALVQHYAESGRREPHRSLWSWFSSRRRPVTGGGENDRWRLLAAFLVDVRREPLENDRKQPEELGDGWSNAEHATILLLILYPRVAMCQLAGQAPLEMQEQLVHPG
jgi:hypothetical protein